MKLPDPSMYNEVIQNPKLCFSDPELMGGVPKTNKWGIPSPISGQNALVYEITTPSKKTYAVRCFLRYDPDQKERYQKISDYLGKRNLKYTVGFKFIEAGIKVQNAWYPILKMDWVEGEPLDDYLNKNFQNQNLMSQLSYRFLEMLIDIKKASIAHCDLQHGNILVVNNELKLVDYDTMFIPDFAGKRSLAFGHINYQHPSKVFQTFDKNMDNFSAWVIFSSLALVATRSNFWIEEHPDLQGNELLFNYDDFINPEKSSILKKLKNNPHPSIMKFGKLMNSLMISPELLPSPVDYTLPQFTSDISWIDQYVNSLLNFNSYTGVRATTAETAEPPGYVDYIRKGIPTLKPWYMEKYEDVETPVSNDLKPDKMPVHGGCSFCGKREYLPWKCNYCGGMFCGDHRMPFNHDCPGIERYKKSNTRY
jgi:serine/threonine protein kinase